MILITTEEENYEFVIGKGKKFPEISYIEGIKSLYASDNELNDILYLFSDIKWNYGEKEITNLSIPYCFKLNEMFWYGDTAKTIYSTLKNIYY